MKLHWHCILSPRKISTSSPTALPEFSSSFLISEKIERVDTTVGYFIVFVIGGIENLIETPNFLSVE